MVFPLLAPFSDSDYPIDAPKKAPEIAESTVMMARMITPQMFLGGMVGVSSNMSFIIFNIYRFTSVRDYALRTSVTLGLFNDIS